ncbi:hypothetical protein E4U17_005764 [Claviceps sp. LM77 group G4]|nr:hypothetical protein E4U17_005764 [Claviceps sp. LM77 group G4]KAG6079673.1 hypothetical protein E4U33_000115 [Claviceps sp. LM78 group G4]KAG6084252.1 hypothetical protein E4U16_002289 [Claviceps sp. LM84 group G4]
MSDTQYPNTEMKIILYLAAGCPQGISIRGELKILKLEHEVRYIDLTKNEHREPWFLEISPIGIIPAITETVWGDEVAVFGTAAILRYLHNQFGRRNRAASALITDIGQHNPNDKPRIVDFYKGQMELLYYCLSELFPETGTAFIGGNDETIADLAAFEWLYSHDLLGISLEKFSILDSYYEFGMSFLEMDDCVQVPLTTFVLF